jgi:hypothetical protein
MAWSLHKVVRNDDIEILGVSDHDWGNEKEFQGAALFYFDKKTGRAQLDAVEGADKKPITEIGICEVVKQLIWIGIVNVCHWRKADVAPRR